MNKNEAEGGLRRIPLSDEILQYRQEAFDRGDSFVLSPDEGRSLVAEVRDLRRLAEMVSKRHHDHDERGVCFWCGKPWPCVDYADVLALSPRSSRGGEGNAP